MMTSTKSDNGVTKGYYDEVFQFPVKRDFKVSSDVNSASYSILNGALSFWNWNQPSPEIIVKIHANLHLKFPTKQVVFWPEKNLKVEKLCGRG